jgi:hypothetical protein
MERVWISSEPLPGSFRGLSERDRKMLRFQGRGGLEWSSEGSLSYRRKLPQYHHAKLHTIESISLIVVVVVVDLDLLNDPQFGLNSTGRHPVRWVPKRATSPSATSISNFRR